MSTRKLPIIDKQLARAINQYLSQAGFTNTSAALQDECETRKISLNKSTKNHIRSSQLEDFKRRLLQAFENGKQTAFFKIWDELFSKAPTRSSISILEFRLHIYFATIPLRRHPTDKHEYKEKLVDLKHYLEEGPGSKLAVNSELVPYFALPYVTDIHKHPVFKELLQPKITSGSCSPYPKSSQRVPSCL
uniref:LisH domain-containing protein n=1 Tax=Acrobeloides nanus TaxID=290746 RepID=A0A914E5I9_9BILA